MGWIERARDVAGQIRADEGLTTPMTVTDGRAWNGNRLRVSNKIISNSVRCLHGQQPGPFAVSGAALWDRRAFPSAERASLFNLGSGW